MSIPYVSLNNHSQYSILSALSSPKDMFEKAKSLGQTALAVTDYGTLSGVWECLNASKAAGVNFIPGLTTYFLENHADNNEKIKYLVLLAKNAVGYRNLLSLNRDGFDSSRLVNKKVYSVINWDILEKYHEGLICLTGCGNGLVSQSIMKKDFLQAENQLKKLSDLFEENLAVELIASNTSRAETYYTGKYNQQFVNYHLVQLAQKLNLKVVPSSCSFYINKEDAETNDVQNAIASFQPVYSNSRTKYELADYYLKSGQEIFEFFSRSFGEDFSKKICENTIELASLCEKSEWIDPAFSNPTKKELPEFKVIDEEDYNIFKEWQTTQSDIIKKLPDDSAYLRYKCELTFKQKIPLNSTKEYRERLAEEFDVIEYRGFSSYLLIVADYVSFAKKNKIRMSYGRGSVGGSLVAFLLGIHDADPIKYKLIFARFHNKDKAGYPDIDLDFTQANRYKIQDYLINKYGKDYVGHVSNLNTITPKVYAKDVARACVFGGSREEAVKIGNMIADVIPSDAGSMKSLIEKAPLFNEYAKRYDKLIKYKNICGQYRAFSTHAAGLVIGKRALKGLVPLRKDKDNAIAVEFDKDVCEEVGLIKMDILGLKTLDIIDHTMELIKQSGKELPPDPPDVNVYDKKTYDLISDGNTLCIFQFGTSAGTIDLCKKIKPKTLEDLSQITSIARPSTKHIREDFILAKHGKKKIKLAHPLLKRAFEETYGFAIYEESLLFLAQDVAGWSLHDADRLRKLTKMKGSDPKKAEAWRQDFIESAVKHGRDRQMAVDIWSKSVEGFGDYGFNHAHAILYSMLSHHTAYLKAHYPLEFLVANLMSEINSGNLKNSRPMIDAIKQEIRQHDIKILPPDLNQSIYDYKLTNNNTLLSGFGGIRNLGDDAIDDIIEKRPFQSFNDFMARIDSSKVRSSAIQALACVGALDEFNISRKNIFLYCSDYRAKLKIWMKKHDINREQFNYNWDKIEKQNWTVQELYALEHHYYGEGFICNKTKAYEPFFNEGPIQNKSLLINQCKELPNKTKIPSFKFEIKSFFELTVKKASSKLYGKTFWKCVAEDISGTQCALTIFPDQLENLRNKSTQLTKGRLAVDIGWVVYCSVSVNVYEDEFGLILDNIYTVNTPPLLPKDLKKKEISLKKEKKQIVSVIEMDKDTKSEICELEDELFDAGLIDFPEAII